MFRNAFITSLAISAAAAAPAAARPADVNVLNTVAIAGTVGLEPGTSVGIDPAANGVEITNSAPVPVAPVAADTRAFSARVQLEPGDNAGNSPVAVPDTLGGGRFQSAFVYANTLVNDGTRVVLTYTTKLDGQFHQQVLPTQANDLPGPLTQWVAALPAVTVADEAFLAFQRAGDVSNAASARIDVYGSVLPASGS